MNRRIFSIAFILLCSMMLFAPISFAAEVSYFNIIDETGNIVYITGWQVKVGDQCLTAENKRYEVISVAGNTAKARFIGDVNMSLYMPGNTFNYAGLLGVSVANAQDSGKVAIYHTHSDESYVPTDGKESILGDGGIYKVGDAFASALKAQGLEVVHSMAKHDPHDDMAYERSRRTVMELLKQQPNAIFDVHRDAVPPEVYKTSINGQDVSKVQLVVGKYGPTGKQIEDYAMQIKAAADQQHPGLIKGIFFAKGGDYNQDLYPRSMLLEVGAHTNDRASAEKGIALFADVVPTILGKTSAGAANQEGAAGVGTTETGFSGSTKSTFWLIGLVVLGSAAFLFLSTGSVKEAKSKLKQFTSTEFANFFGPKKRNRKEKDDQDES
ncbi:MAG: stage II sporulation protein P [Pelosinus sp.]|nr:stage II sporulation protein P [Pelosinus sp.]